MEALFLQAVERGDRKAIIYALENAPDLNINCLDSDGKSALVKAIENGNSGKLETLKVREQIRPQKQASAQAHKDKSNDKA